MAKRHQWASALHSPADTLRERAASARAAVGDRLPQATRHELELLAQSVEQHLIDANREYEALLYTYDRAGNLKDVVPKSMHHAEYEGVEIHTLRRMRAIWRRALALPATSILALGLQARLVATQVDDWWEEEDLMKGEAGCRQILDALIGLAGLSHIKRPDVSVAQLQGRLVDPETGPGGCRRQKAA